jgi:hypothetical protein
MKGKDSEANTDGKENERNGKEIKEVLKNINSEGTNVCIWLRVVRDKINFCCFRN